MKIVIDRLTDDVYGERNASRVIGRDVDIDTLKALPDGDWDYGYCKGLYRINGIISGSCQSFTFVCLDDEGYPL